MSTNVDEYRRARKATKPRKNPEDQLLCAVVTMARQLDYLVYHPLTARTLKGWRTSMMGHIGFPDLTLARAPHPALPWHTARFLMVELKSRRGRLPEHQELWFDVLRDAGVEVHVWTPRELDDGTIAHVLSDGMAT